MDNVRDAWIRRVAAQHFVKSAVVLGGGCKHITVADCRAAQWVGMISGSRRFAFQNNGCLNLFRDCHSDQGRHSFVMGGGVGPNVFLDCEATRPYGSSEPHGSLIVGTLYDNVKAPLAFRFARSSGGGRWMGFNSFAWNCEGPFLGVCIMLDLDFCTLVHHGLLRLLTLGALCYLRSSTDEGR
jgi:hypothetical protein